MKKNLNFVLLLLVGMMLAFVVSASAETTLADVQAKLTSAKSAGVTTLADVQAQLREAKKRQELIRIDRIVKNFGTSDLHALKLTSGNTIGNIAKVVSNNGFLGIGKMVKANGLTMPQCNNLHAGFIFYIPTSMIKKDLVLNAYEVALLKQNLSEAKASASRLTAEVGQLNETIVVKNGEIAELNQVLKEEVAAHGKTKSLLADEQAAHSVTKKELDGKTTLSSKLGEKAGALEAKSSTWKLVAFALACSLVLIIGGIIALMKGNKNTSSKEELKKKFRKESETQEPLAA